MHHKTAVYMEHVLSDFLEEIGRGIKCIYTTNKEDIEHALYQPTDCYRKGYLEYLREILEVDFWNAINRAKAIP